MRRLISWWQQRRRGPLTDEICRHCHRQLGQREARQAVHHYAPNAVEAELGGGTFGTTYWCSAHAPADAERADLPALLNTARAH